jgi:hypothetical protein
MSVVWGVAHVVRSFVKVAASAVWSPLMVSSVRGLFRGSIRV